MNTGFDISIIISSYNRDDKVLQTIQHLFASDFSGFAGVEVIVIDDGSPSPVEKLLKQVTLVPANVKWRVVTQNNSGIGATRNRGYREASAGIVIFLDDDILVYPDTIRKLYNAIQNGQGTVIFGSYPFISHSSESVKMFATQLYGYDAITDEEKYEKVNAITSGLLAVSKTKMPNPDFFYKDNLRVPAAEEHELIARFQRIGIPIYMATHIKALHNHHLKLPWLVQQQYKYGMATAEAFCKEPDIILIEKYSSLKKNLDRPSGKIIKQILSYFFIRRALLLFSLIIENLASKTNHNKLFGVLASAYFRAGYREGLKNFA